MNAGFVFPSALSSCEAGIENHEDSGMSLRYRLTIEPEELEKSSGMKLASADPIILYEGGPIKPGEKIDNFKLNPLPGGALLPQGEYNAVMTVIPSEARGGAFLGSEYALQLSVRVMVSQMQAGADQSGYLDAPIYEGAGGPVRYALMIRAEDIRQPHGIDTEAMGDRHSFTILALSDLISPGQKASLRLSCLPGGEALLPGSYETWLVRMDEDGEAPYVTARLMLDVPGNLQGLPPAPDISFSMADIAQAVVNAEYLLSKP